MKAKQIAFHKAMRVIAKTVAVEVYPYLMEGIKDKVNPPKGTEALAYHSMMGYIAVHLKSLSYEKAVEENRINNKNE
jgi:hypothetical protein|tara:strand:- start:1601 stop:1831 length:231 start_codon:yes stop_codon:yes gene_type:complete